MGKQTNNFLNARIKYLKQLIGKMQQADNVNGETYIVAVNELACLYNGEV